jgi:hypothetical protein
MLSDIRRVRFLMGCTVVQCLTSTGLCGYVTVRGDYRGDPVELCKRVMAAVKSGDTAEFRIKAEQL